MPIQFLKRLRWLLLGGLTASAAQAAVYPLPPPDTDVIGQIKVVYATKDDTLLDVARRHSLGYDEIVHANPGLDRWAPGEGTPIVLPTRYILPDTPREGIVLNIAELRLYYYPPASPGAERVVYTFPVSIGRMDWKTPLGVTRVVAKDIDPPWRPPASIKAEHAAEGDILPDVVPGGPDNPLGRHALRLALPSYLIHGTNRPFGIGMRVTHGCVRMYPEDIEWLFGMVPVGTPVRLIDQPVKVGRLNGELLVESHEPLEEDNIPIKVTLEQAQRAVIAKTGPDMPGVDPAALEVAVEQVSGIPVSIGTEPGSAPAERTAGGPPSGPAPSQPAASQTPTSPVPGYPTASQTPIPYPRPAYNNWPATAPAYRSAPAEPPRYTPPYGAPTADYDELPYPATASPPSDDDRPISAAPAYQPAPPRYTPSYGAPTADYDEPPYPYPTTTPVPPVANPPAYRPTPVNPGPYPRVVPPTARPPAGNAPGASLEPPPVNRL